jgi:integrase
LAPSAAAAAQLRAALGGTTDTIAKLLDGLDRGALSAGLAAIDSSTLVIVDEAAQSSTLDLDQVVTHALSVGASVRLVGDDHQLASIKSGGVLRDIARTVGAATLETPVRFDDPTEGLASLALRRGEPVALGYYLDHDRVHAGDHGTVVTDAVEAWKSAKSDGGESLLGSAHAAGKPMKVEEWFTYWVDTIAPARVRPRTLESYRSMIRLHILPRIGQRRLDQLMPEHLEQMYADILASGRSPATVLRVHRVLHRALKIAVQRERVARNVATLVDPPKQRRAETPMPLDVDECRKVLAAAEGRRNAARWTVALALGLRQSEALGLQWRDIDLEVGKLSVRRGLHRVDGKGLMLEEPKTPRSRRTVALPGPLTAALRKHRETQDLERMVAGTDWQDFDLVFAQPNGRPLDKHSDYEAWTRLLATPVSDTSGFTTAGTPRRPYC